jgi:hypothetical protein
MHAQGPLLVAVGEWIANRLVLLHAAPASAPVPAPAAAKATPEAPQAAAATTPWALREAGVVAMPLGETPRSAALLPLGPEAGCPGGGWGGGRGAPRRWALLVGGNAGLLCVWEAAWEGGALRLGGGRCVRVSSVAVELQLVVPAPGRGASGLGAAAAGDAPRASGGAGGAGAGAEAGAGEEEAEAPYVYVHSGSGAVVRPRARASAPPASGPDPSASGLGGAPAASGRDGLEVVRVHGAAGLRALRHVRAPSMPPGSAAWVSAGGRLVFGRLDLRERLRWTTAYIGAASSQPWRKVRREMWARPIFGAAPCARQGFDLGTEPFNRLPLVGQGIGKPPVEGGGGGGGD